MKQCKGLFGKIFGHKYHARYSEKKGASQLKSEVTGFNLEDIIEKFRDTESIYECDVCVRCGDKLTPTQPERRVK